MSESCARSAAHSVKHAAACSSPINVASRAVTAARYVSSSIFPVRDARYSGMSWNADQSVPAGSPYRAANASNSEASSRRSTPP
jgi:hypothetical protein